MVSVISSILIWGAAAVILIRIIQGAGIWLGNNRLIAGITCDKSIDGGFKTERRELFTVFGLALLFRFCVFMISICAVYMFKDHGYSFSDYMREYLKWDANNYQRIAIGGYSYHMENGDYTTLAFFPLYPWLIRIVKLIFRNEILSGIILSGLLYSGACTYLYKLFSIDYNKPTAVRALVYLSVFPHALFFGVMMNESMLLFTMAATFYYIRTHNWKVVGIFGALAALSRMVGILMAVPAAIEWLEHYEILGKLRDKKIKEVWRLFYSKGLWIFLMLAGLGIYLFCNYKTTGEWFKFLEYQDKYWSNGSCYFGKGITTMVNNMLQKTDSIKYEIWIPEVMSVAFVTAALIYGLRRHRNMYTGFLLIYIIINTGFEWPISIARYMTCAVPAFLILSDFSERHKWTEPIITCCMAMTMGIYLVAYFMFKQIL
ncbi:MAG: glycosyltransferase family 39 protein [Candidatus Ornithomonoglobus sp.]